MRTPNTDLTTAPLAGTAPESRRLELRLRWLHPLAKPDVPLKAGLRFGRAPSCDVQLEGDSTSREHARTSSRGGVLFLEDAKSRNGTFRDGERIELTPLAAGAVLRFGEWLGVVVEGGGDSRGFEEVAPGLFGSERLASAVRQAAAVASSQLSLLITGPTGTGKELLCRAIHDWSGRRGRLVSVNSAALADSLLDAELFGHEAGAFTGASRPRAGLVREAEGGTFFLDEVAELSPLAQAKLLRVLQENEVLPVGGSRQRPVDLRVIAATHRDLEGMSHEGSFRSDLYARLAGLRVELPELRARREDILPLFSKFVTAALGRTPRHSPRFVEALCCYAWPRNVRELKHCAERLALLHPSEPVFHRRHLARALPEPSAPQKRPPSEAPAPRARSKQELVDALRSARGNVTKAAQALEMSRETLYKLTHDHAIVLDELRR